MKHSIRRVPLVTITLAMLAVAIWCGPQALTASLEYDRAAVAAGQLHRLLTCHFTHFTAGHLAWDLLGLCVLGMLCERRGRGAFAATLLLAGLLIPTAVHFLAADPHVYRGLSGLVAALFGLPVTAQLLRGIRDRALAPAFFMGGLLILFGVYVVAQGINPQPLLSLTAGEAFVAVPLAHLIGLLSGAVVALAVTAHDVNTGPMSRTADGHSPLTDLP